MPCRKDYRDLTPDERARLVAALHDAKSRGVVDDFASQHDTYFHAAHHSSVFLPWHREFLRRFEIELRVHDARVTIPYWDWRTDTSTSSDLWDSSFMGGFDSAWSLGRDLGGGGGLADEQAVEDTLALSPYGDFWSPLESNIHDGVHVWVGGVMQTGASPGDPVFYLHHCTIDLLWAQWQLLHPGEDPYQSSGAGFGLDDAMAPWTTTPADVLDHRPIHTYSYPPGFLTDPPIVTLDTPTVVFADIPEGEHAYRAAVVDVQACGTVGLHADPPQVLTGTGSFGVMEADVTVDPDSDPKGRIWVTYQGTSAGDSATGRVDVTVPGTSLSWPVDIIANTVERPTAVAALVLDRSGSMLEPSGIAALTRADVLEFSAPPFVDVLEDGNAAAVTTFDHDPHTLIGITPVAGGGQGLLNGAISDYEPNPDGYTSIGEAVAHAHGLLAVPEAAGYDVRALVVLTDGHENHDGYDRRYIADVADMIDERVYAIGLGTAQALDAGALISLCDGTEGFMLMTGALGSDAYFRVAKYYQQILAGVTNNEIVEDPEGYLLHGQTHRLPFVINDADVTATAVLLTPAPWAVEWALETPGGEFVDVPFASTSPAVVHDSGDDVTYYRTQLPLPIGAGDAHAGIWHAVLRLRRRGAGFATHALESTAGQTGGALRYSFSVHAYSGLRLRVTLGQTSFEPGATVTVRALLSESGLPVRGATVGTDLERPDGSTVALPMAPAEPGAYEASFAAPIAGIYRCDVRARGHSARGRPFTREQLRTAAVWAGGDKPFPTSASEPDRRPDRLCRFLICLLRQKGLVARLEREGIDVRALRRCLAELCREGSPPRKREAQSLARLQERMVSVLGAERIAELMEEVDREDT